MFRFQQSIIKTLLWILPNLERQAHPTSPSDSTKIESCPRSCHYFFILNFLLAVSVLFKNYFSHVSQEKNKSLNTDQCSVLFEHIFHSFHIFPKVCQWYPTAQIIREWINFKDTFKISLTLCKRLCWEHLHQPNTVSMCPPVVHLWNNSNVVLRAQEKRQTWTHEFDLCWIF